MTQFSRAKWAARRVIKLIDYQISIEQALFCRKCNDIAIYRYPEKYPLKMIICDKCYRDNCMTKNVPRSEIYS